MRDLTIAVITLAVMLACCPVGGCGTMSIYDKAKIGIAYAPLGYVTADAIVDLYCKRNPNEAKTTKAKYADIKEAVKTGLAALKAGIDVAEEAGREVDMVELNRKISKLVKEVLDFAFALEGAIRPATPQPISSSSLAAWFELMRKDLHQSMLAFVMDGR